MRPLSFSLLLGFAVLLLGACSEDSPELRDVPDSDTQDGAPDAEDESSPDSDDTDLADTDTEVDLVCTARDHQACVAGNLYWFDDCEHQGELAQDCPGGCTGSLCDVVCTPEASKACVDGKLYWFDDCSTQGALAEDCAAGCTDGACDPVAPVFHLEADFTTEYSTHPADFCNTAVYRSLYRGRLSSLVGNLATMDFVKCVDGALQAPERLYSIVSSTEPLLAESETLNYLARVEGTYSDAEVSLSSDSVTATIRDIPVWPDTAALEAAECGAVMHLGLITDGAGSLNVRTWYQYQTVTFTKVCE